jgi:hypothetical protein
MVLAAQAQKVIKAAGYASGSAHADYGFCAADEVKPFFFGGHPWEAESARFATGVSNELLFWYRQSPDRLVPQSVQNVVFRRAQVTPVDPPLREAGAVVIVLDLSGRLLFFTAVPRREVETLTESDVDRWLEFFSRAGLDRETFAPEPPPDIPLPSADRLLAWEGAHPEEGEKDVYVAAASVRGKPVLFGVLQAEDPAAAPFYQNQRRRRATMHTASVALLIVLALVAAPWAQRNLTAVRCDRQAARRVAIWFFALRMILWLLQAKHVPDVGTELMLLTVAILRAGGEALLAWLSYLALEPQARRLWPQVMVAWKRILSLQFRDATVGQHILIGSGLGAYIAVIIALDPLLIQWLGWTRRPPVIEPDRFLPLLSGRCALAAGISCLYAAVEYALLFVLLLVGLIAVVRRRAVAAILAVVIVAPLFLPGAGNAGTMWLTHGVACLGLGTWLTLRFGLVVLSTALFVCSVLLTFPAWREGAWYTDLSYFALAVAAVTALYGFLVARHPGPRT